MLASYFRMAILSYRVRDAFSKALIVPKWSSLRALGQSRLLAPTVFVPFLGALIVFNQQFVDLLLISPAVVGLWMGSVDYNAVDTSRAFTLNRLYSAYFGLSLLGLASFLFTLFCPREVKTNSTISEFISSEQPLITRPRLFLLVRDVAEDCLVNEGEEEAWGPKFLRRLAYPPELWAFFHTAFTAIAEKIDFDDFAPAPSEDPRVNRQDHADLEAAGGGLDVYTGVGTINVERVARLVFLQQRVFMVFWRSFIESAHDSVVDLLALRYLALDHSKPSLRILVTGSYVLGFLILFYPTVITFALILRQVLFR